MRYLKTAMEAYDETDTGAIVNDTDDFEVNYLERAAVPSDVVSNELTEAVDVVQDLEMLSDQQLSLDDASALDAEHGCTVGMESYTAAYDPAKRYKVAMESALTKVKEVGKRVLQAIIDFLKKFSDWILATVTKFKSLFKSYPRREMDKAMKYSGVLDDLFSAEGRKEAAKFIDNLPQNQRGLMDFQGCLPYFEAIKKEAFQEQKFQEARSAIKRLDREQPETAKRLEDAAGEINEQLDRFNQYREEVKESQLRSWVSTTSRTITLLNKLQRAFDISDDEELIKAFTKRAEACKQFSLDLAEVSEELYSEQASVSKEDDFENVQGPNSIKISDKLEIVRAAGNLVRAIAKACGTLVGVQKALYDLFAKFYNHIDALLAKLEDKRFAILFSTKGIGYYNKDSVKQLRKDMKDIAANLALARASKGL